MWQSKLALKVGFGFICWLSFWLVQFCCLFFVASFLKANGCQNRLRSSVGIAHREPCCEPVYTVYMFSLKGDFGPFSKLKQIIEINVEHLDLIGFENLLKVQKLKTSIAICHTSPIDEKIAIYPKYLNWQQSLRRTIRLVKSVWLHCHKNS